SCGRYVFRGRAYCRSRPDVNGRAVNNAPWTGLEPAVRSPPCGSAAVVPSQAVDRQAWPVQASRSDARPASGLDSLWFYLNCANDGSTTGAWWTVGSVAATGTHGTVAMTIDPNSGSNACARPMSGTHAVVVNAKLAPGAYTGDWFDTSLNRWWIVWDSNPTD